MAETEPFVQDQNQKLQEILAETPWIEEKFTALHGLLIGLAERRNWEDGVTPRKLTAVGDSEFTDWRLALTFRTDDPITTAYHHVDGRGTAAIQFDRKAKGPVERELIALFPGAIIWTRSDDGLFAHEVGRRLARGEASLALGLSRRFREETLRKS